MVADIWVTFREELDMCGIREDKQSSFRPGEPETKWASELWEIEWQSEHCWYSPIEDSLTIGGFQYHKSPRGSILISSGCPQTKKPPEWEMSFNEGRREQPWRLARGESGMREDANTKTRKPAPANNRVYILARTSLETPEIFWERPSCEEYLRCRRQSHSNERETKHKQKQQCSGNTRSRTLKYSHT